jgi:hypothetical protein
MTTKTQTPVELLEQVADRIASATSERDCGIAWAEGKRTDLHELLEEPFEPDQILIRLLWEGAMGMCAIRRLLTVKLPSGRELLVDDYDAAPFSQVIGVVDRDDDNAHLRAFQAAISGEQTEDPLLVGFPSELRLAFGGVVLLDALAEGLRRSPVAEEFLTDASVDWFVHGAGDDAKQRLLTALEEDLQEPLDDEHADRAAELLEQAESTPAWLWVIEAEDAERIARLADQKPPIPLYTPPGIPATFDPIEEGDDPLYRAAAVLVACGEL